jgi:hypothetical protein
MTIVAIAYEKGGVTTPLEQRPSIQWQEKSEGLGAAPVASAASSPDTGGKK